MPAAEVTLVISDWTKGSNGRKYELPHISMSSTIAEVKKSVLQALTVPDQEPESILLFMGNLHLEDEKLLKDYNKSNRSKLSVDVHERVDFNLRVKTLQQCGSGGCVCVPIWSFLCRQTVNITIADYKTVGDLKQQIAHELDDPDRYTAENIRLIFKSSMLYDDKQVLKDVPGLQKDSVITLLVDCCYWVNSRKPDSQQAADSPNQAAVQEVAVAASGNAEETGERDEGSQECDAEGSKEEAQDAPKEDQYKED